MKHALAAPALLLSLAASLTQVQAQAQQMQAGLWEYGHSMKTQSGQAEKAMAQMQQQMASLPPEQRKMMEKMMADQGVAFGPTGQTVRVCVSKEDAAREEIPMQDGCTQKTKRNGNTYQISFSCAQPPSSGEGKVVFSSPTAYTGDFTVKVQEQGRTELMQMKQTGKWVSADCGTLKPAKR
jgi:Protein of unknown function (DUF3617)